MVCLFFVFVQNMKCPNYPNKVDALDTRFTQIYKQQTFEPYSVDGQVTGQYKNAGTFSYLRIYGAGHEVAAYKVCCFFPFFHMFIVPRLIIYSSLVIWLMVKLLPNFSHK